jgi:hypothetical protein
MDGHLLVVAGDGDVDGGFEQVGLGREGELDGGHRHACRGGDGGHGRPGITVGAERRGCRLEDPGPGTAGLCVTYRRAVPTPTGLLMLDGCARPSFH